MLSKIFNHLMLNLELFIPVRINFQMTQKLNRTTDLNKVIYYVDHLTERNIQNTKNSKLGMPRREHIS